MSKKIKTNTFLNIATSILLQIVAIISAFIVPRITLSLFGSEVNGLINSLTQFLSYINLFEAGVGGVIATSLYKPVVDGDSRKISSIMNASRSFYRKIGAVLIAYSMGLAVLYPIFTSTAFSFEYISSMTLIIAFQLYMQSVFAYPYQQLLRVNKKVYVVSTIQIVSTILNTAIYSIMALIMPNIHLMKMVASIVYLVQPILLNYYVRKKYPIDKKVEKDASALQNRWDGFAINTAYFIHNSTDISILTIFKDLSTVSIYAVHAIVTNGIRKILQAISSAVIPNIGQLYAKGDKKILNEKFDIVEFAYFAITAGFLTMAGLLITPFVKIYTGGVLDAEYYQPIFATILVAAEFVYCIREPYFGLAQVAGRFKDMRVHAYIEAGLNLISSIILVQQFGLIGIAIGTLIGNTYRTIYHVIYLKKHILYRSPKIFFKKLIVFGIATVLSVLICTLFFPIQEGILSFVVNAILYASITAFFYLVASAIFYRKELRELKLL